jgi:hypothetical protein
MKSSIRRSIQVSLLAANLLGLTQCVDGVTAARNESSTFGIVPTWDSRAAQTIGVLDEGGFPLDRVRVILVFPVSDTVKDTTITVHHNDPQIDLALTVSVTPGVTLQATLQFKSGETLLYQGSAEVATVPLNRPSPAPASLVMQYFGPGSNATRVSVTPGSGSFTTAANVVFTGTAFDGADAPLPGTPLDWTVSDPTMGSFSSGGVFVPSGKGGQVAVTATTPTGIAGSATITLIPPGTVPASVQVVSGSGQSGIVFSTLSPFVVKVVDAGGTPVSGATVTWTRTAGFGSPANATSTTDAGGLATLTYQLGDLLGTETITASVTGVATTATFTVFAIGGDVGVPIVTGFAYLRVQPSPASPRVGDTLTLTADSISATGQATPVTAQWASSNPGRGSIDANGRLIVADTGAIIITATRNGLIGHARVTVVPAPMLTGFSFSPKTLNGVTAVPVTSSFTFSARDAGTGITSATLTLTGPGGVTQTCTFGAPTIGTKNNGSFDCPLTFPAGTAAGAWHATSLTLNGSITRTYGESVLALFSSTTLTINP